MLASEGAFGRVFLELVTLVALLFQVLDNLLTLLTLFVAKVNPLVMYQLCCADLLLQITVITSLKVPHHIGSQIVEESAGVISACH